ncbi:ecdysone 20-monooxygenase-like [Neocloeon triangulifer]|uniref:ecdysone 20-monooxygenase-like n=1 Tax=Neocloeon triangulifer TaxID=2078957 RepID=UPI00286F3F3B|nr:ecdysone 20-monooxygenase-like [Neocloeon triangulifer]
MRLVVAFMSGLLAALLEPVKFTWRHLLVWLQGLITAAEIKFALQQKEALFATEVAPRPVVPSLKDIPGPTPLPFFGTGWIFNRFFGRFPLTKVHDAYKTMFREYGPIIKEEALWNYPVLSISTAQDIEKIIKIPTKSPIRPPTSITAFYRTGFPERYNDGGLINEQGEKWHRLRTALTHDLTNTRVVQGFVPEVNNMARDFLACIAKLRNPNNGFVENVIELDRKLGFESTCLMNLGCRVGFLEEEVNQRAQRLSDLTNVHFEMVNESYYGLALWKFFPTSTWKKFSEAEHDLYELICEYLEPVIEAAGESCQFDDVQNILLGILKRSDLDDKDKKSGIIDFIASGMNTIGNSITMMLYLMAKNPEAQSKIYEEIQSQLEPDEEITAKFLHSAKYLKACIQESFRILPTATCVARITEIDLNLSGYHVPAGSVVLSHTSEACRSEANFVRPDEFIPERWIASEVERNPSLHVKYPFLVSPFGFQRRMCPGKKFAEQVMQIVLASVIRRYELRCERDLELEFKFLLAPTGQFSLQFKERT